MITKRHCHMVFHPVKFSVKAQCHEYSYHSGDDISGRLGIEDAIDTGKEREDQDNRHKADTLSAGTQDKSLFSFSECQKQGGIYRVESEQQKGNAIGSQRLAADLDHFQIPLSKQGDKSCGKQSGNSPIDDTKNSGPKNRKTYCLVEASIFFGAIAVSGNWLKTFDKAKNHETAYGDDSCNRTHPCNDRVPIFLCLKIDKGDRKTGQKLENHSGNTDF